MPREWRTPRIGWRTQSLVLISAQAHKRSGRDGDTGAQVIDPGEIREGDHIYCGGVSACHGAFRVGTRSRQPAGPVCNSAMRVDCTPVMRTYGWVLADSVAFFF